MALTKTTAGHNSIVSDRSFGYAGITLYEAIVPAPFLGGFEAFGENMRLISHAVQ